MALPALIVAAIARIRAANNNAYDAVNNPAGLGQGGQRQNFIPDINAVADIGVFAGECVDKADADVVLTHADVQLTHQDASNTALDRIATAQSVLDAAGKVALAGAEADRAKAQADLAKGYAAGVKLPVIDASMVGRFLKVGVDGSGNAVYELGEITIATSAQLLAGTGKGIANAETLGPILADMKAKTADVTAAAVPIGGYLAVPFSIDPGPKFVRAAGQKISLATYPKASVIPVLAGSDLTQFPWQGAFDNLIFSATLNGANSTTEGSTLRTADVVGNRVVLIQENYLRYFELAGTVPIVQRGAVVSTGATNGYPAILRDNDVVYITSSGKPSHLSIAAGNFGAIGTPTTTNSSLDDQTKLMVLPNGTILAFGNTNSITGQITRVRKTEGAANWTQFLPGGVPFLLDYRAWQDKLGRIYIARRTNNGENYTVYRTADGEAWANLGVLAGSSGYTLSVHYSWHWRDSRRPAAPAYRESPDGKQMLVRLGAINNQGAVLASNNSGDSWTLLTREVVFSGLPTTPIGNGSNTQERGSLIFEWDRYRSRWTFGIAWRNTTQVWYAVAHSSDLVAFTNLVSPQFPFTNYTTSATDTVRSFTILCMTDDIRLYVTTNNGFPRYNVRINPTTGAITNNQSYPDDSQFYVPVIAIDFPNFDGYVLGMSYNGGNGPPSFDNLYSAMDSGIRWMSRDGLFNVAPSTNPYSGSGQPVVFFVNDTYILGGALTAIQIAARYNYNPATERVVNRVNHDLSNASTSGLLGTSSQKGTQYGFAWYMRVD